MQKASGKRSIKSLQLKEISIAIVSPINAIVPHKFKFKHQELRSFVANVIATKYL
jgi:hypothetical protein